MTVFTSNIDVSVSDVYSGSGAQPDITGVQATIAQASSMIETIVGVPFVADARVFPLSTADAYWIKRAVVFQVIWLMGQAATLERQAVTSLSQDGVSFTAPDELTFVLAPLAKRSLNNCSWAKTGTLKVSAPSDTPALSPLISDNHPWTPLGVA